MEVKPDATIKNEDGSVTLIEHKMNQNKRHPKEYKLVTDGKKMYRLAPKFNIPDGVKEVFEFEGKKYIQAKVN